MQSFQIRSYYNFVELLVAYLFLQGSSKICVLALLQTDEWEMHIPPEAQVLGLCSFVV